MTRPKPAYGRQGLDWIVGPGYSFVVFWTNKTMETNQKPWNQLEKPWKPTKNREKPWNHLETNLNPWKPIKTDMEPWKTNLEPSKLTWSWTGWLWGVQVVTGDSQEEVIIFRDRQTNRQTLIIIYISSLPLSKSSFIITVHRLQMNSSTIAKL